MLDVASSHSAPKPPSPASSGGGKRIPASIMKMRRESLATSGKYQLPTVNADALPENSLMGMASKIKSQSAHGGSAALPSFVTPMRYTNKSLKAALDLATSHLPTSVGDLLFDSTPAFAAVNDNENKESPDTIPEGSVSNGTVGSSSNSRRKTLRRAHTIDSTTTDSKDMDSLLRSGLATPRRTRRSFAIPQDATAQSRQRISKLQKASRKSSITSATDSINSSGSSNQSNGGEARRRMSRPVRSKSSDDAVHVLCTPRRVSRKPKVSVSRTGSNRDEPSSSCSSDDTPVPVAPAATSWKCTCGEEQAIECKFCGMCGTAQRWECADCSYANKSKFRFCGMCGIPKKVKGEE